MTGLSIGHGSQNMVEIESVTLCTHNKLSLWNGMIDLQRWRLHLEWGLCLPTLRDIYETFSFTREILCCFFFSWVKGGYEKKKCDQAIYLFIFFSFSSDSMVQFDRKALEIVLKSVPLFGSYHCLSLSPQAFKLPSPAFTEAFEVWELKSFGQRWYDIKAKMVKRSDGICLLTFQGLNWWVHMDTTQHLITSAASKASHLLKYNHIFLSNRNPTKKKTRITHTSITRIKKRMFTWLLLSYKSSLKDLWKSCSLCLLEFFDFNLIFNSALILRCITISHFQGQRESLLN